MKLWRTCQELRQCNTITSCPWISAGYGREACKTVFTSMLKKLLDQARKEWHLNGIWFLETCPNFIHLPGGGESGWDGIRDLAAFTWSAFRSLIGTSY